MHSTTPEGKAVRLTFFVRSSQLKALEHLYMVLSLAIRTVIVGLQAFIIEKC